MPFNAALAGTRQNSVTWEATPRRILAFRAVLAPDDGDGLDDAAGELEALPMQVVSPEWILALAARDHPAQTLTEEELRRGVHVSQDTRFIRPILAGEVLSVTGQLVGVRPSRAGAVATTHYQTVSATTGETLATSTSVSIYRGAEVAGSPVILEPQPEPPAWEPDGEPRLVRTPRGFPHQYSECAEIWNPIHTERRVALAAGLSDILIHGTALWALAGLGVTAPGARLVRLAGHFRSPAWAGQDMWLQAGRASGGATPFRLTSAEGVLLTDGFAAFA